MIYQYKEKIFNGTIIRFSNTKLKRLNNLIGKNIFYKNDLFVDATTLYDLMQPEGERGTRHNFHGLQPETIWIVLNQLNSPVCVLNEGINRYAIVLLAKDKDGVPLLTVIQTGCRLGDEESANINKLVTMFRKEKILNFIKSFDIKDIIYLNQIEINKIK